MAENIVLYCNCQSRKGTSEWIKTATMLDRLDEIHLITLTDLCGLCAIDSNKLVEAIEKSSKILLIACHPRAVRLVLDKAGISGTDKIQFFNLLEENTDALAQILKDYKPDDPGQFLKTELVSDPSWPAWYPVIDSKRCNNCGQCADFCLFGVYRKTDEKVVVAHPEKCKNQCPACARICPRVAIIFPKFAPGGVIGGSGSIDETLEMQRIQQDTDAILGSDIYQSLEQRKLKRRMVIRDDAVQRAIHEREEALNNVKKL